MLVVEEVLCQSVVDLLALLESTSKTSQGVREFLVLHLELLVSNKSVSFEGGYRLLEDLLLGSKVLLKLFGFDCKPVNLFIRQDYGLNDPCAEVLGVNCATTSKGSN